MDKRYSKRYAVFFDADIIFGTRRENCFIKNISGNGLSLQTESDERGIDFTPGNIFNLKIRLSSEETLDLQCRLVRACEIPAGEQDGKPAYSLGMEIISSFSGYKSFYNNVAMKKIRDLVNSMISNFYMI